jgi:D-serine deaminase-like pyridoxal phosphate-dependent protein
MSLDLSASPSQGARLEALATAAGTEDRPTPFVAIELDTFDANCARMQRAFAGRTARVRSHVKTHKSTALARMQVAVHGGGVTCSTTDEVAAMVGAGIDDVLLANVVTDLPRLRSLAASSHRGRVTVAVDSPAALELLAKVIREAEAQIGVVIERDIGMSRNGITSIEEGLALAEAIERAPGLDLRGVMAYEGHLVAIEDRAERARQAGEAFVPALDLLAELRRHGWDAPVLTGGSTATYDSTGALAEMTDVQAGTYALMDNIYVRLTPEFRPAVAVVGSVLTVRSEGTIVLDIGSKRLGTDWGTPRLAGIQSEHLYTAEEHTVMRLLEGERPSVGDRMALIPGHACTTMTRYAVALGCRNARLEQLLPIDAQAGEEAAA